MVCLRGRGDKELFVLLNRSTSSSLSVYLSAYLEMSNSMASMTAGQNKSSRGADAFAPPSQVSGRWVEGEGWMFIRKLTTKGNNLLITCLFIISGYCQMYGCLFSLFYSLCNIHVTTPEESRGGVYGKLHCVLLQLLCLYDSMFYTRCCIPYLLCNQTWKMFVMIVWNIWFPNTSLLYPYACYLFLTIMDAQCPIFKQSLSHGVV